MLFYTAQSLIAAFIRRTFHSLGDDFVNFATKEIFESEKICRLGFPAHLSSYFPPYPSKAFRTFVQAMHSLKRGVPVPEMVNIAVTNRCPYDCWHCSTAKFEQQEMKSSELRDLIEQFLEQGTYHFGFTGGEPLLRNDLPELIAAIRGRAISVIYTTGYGFTEKFAVHLKKAQLTTIHISLDHSNPEIHDRLRNYQDAFKHSLEAIIRAKRLGFVTSVTTVATPERIESGELITFLHWLKKLKVEEVTIFEPVPTGKVTDQPDLFLSDKYRQKLMQLHKSANSSHRFPRVVALPFVESHERMGCQAGTTRFYVTAGGDVTPCDFTPLSFGNVQDEPVATILSRMNSVFQKPRKSCFYREYYHRIHAQDHEHLPLPLSQSMEICASLSPSPTPLFYRRLQGAE